MTEFMRFTIAPPGHLPLERRRFSLIDVPDLHALPDRWPQATLVWMGAAPAPASLHWALTAFAWLVRVRLMPTLSWLAGVMYFVTDHARWGEHRGGMFVEVRGRLPSGQAVVREWHLLAEGSDGPLIPCMGIEAVIRKSLSGRQPPAGARTALADVDLSDYETLFSRRTIYTGVRERLPTADTPLFQRILGQAWYQLAAEIRQLHCVTTTCSFAGRCDVDRGRNPLARLLGRLIGFPKAGHDQVLSVQLSVQGDAERWVRSSGNRVFASILSAGRGSSQWLIRERFGPVTMDMALVVEGTSLRYIVRRCTLFGVPLPLLVAPRATAVESVRDGKFSFDVEISHALIGLIVRYRGVLTAIPESQSDDFNPGLMEERPGPA